MTAFEEGWLKLLVPGTLLVNKSGKKAYQAFFLVIHTDVKLFPGKWLELRVTLLTPWCTLRTLEVESGIFSSHWTIIDVDG